ncbi:MAG: YbaK/EbsC family protein, partial [Gemmatimonadota bacterium]|nr:YbaK/EbsC family protein [Gemmatimonadota bacterium]
KTVVVVAALLKRDPKAFVTTLLFVAAGVVVAAVVRGDREIAETKLGDHLGADRLEMAGPDRVKEVTGAEIGFAGPHTLPDDVRVVADYSLAGRGDLVAGANRTDYHVTGLEIGRDVEPDEWGDLMTIVGGDPCPKCGEGLDATRGIEVGHVFKLGTKYSEAMGATYQDEAGEQHPFLMGCYGLGVTRTAAAAIEQNHDEQGIVWPVPVAPFEVEIIPLNMDSEAVVETADRLYEACRAAGLETLLDDRPDRAGSKFADADLIGVPWRIVIGDRGLSEGVVEVAARRAKKDVEKLPPDEAVSLLVERVEAERR